VPLRVETDPYPRGWFHVAWSRDVPRGVVKPLRWFDREIAVFRGADGVVRALDGHCPHKGAHLGHGSVVGDTVRCPFHGTCYDGSGTAVTTDVPRDGAQLHARPWPVHEAFGMIFVFHQPDPAGPAWAFPEVPELADDGEPWVPFREKTWVLRGEFRDFLENATDLLHFRTVHQFSSGDVTNLRADGTDLRYLISLKVAAPVFGEITSVADVAFYGLGLILFRPVEAKTRFRFLQTLTRVSPTHIASTSVLFIKRRDWLKDLPLNLVQWHLNCRSFDQDFRIYEHRTHHDYAPTDDLGRTIKGWYDQFFVPAGGPP
jgi:nitrite reductase/ring-hydroxylating ferredoxin subunit